MITHYSVCIERCCPLESIQGFFWLQIWINYIAVPLEYVYVETIQDVRMYVHLFHRSSDLLTYLKFQYSKVTYVTISFTEVVLISFRCLLANASEEHFLVYGVCCDFYPLSLTFLNYFFLNSSFQTSLREKKSWRRAEAKSTPCFFTRPAEKGKGRPLLFMSHQNKRPL